MNKVIVIGLDGATFDLLTPWMDQGDLPHLQHLVKNGVWGKLRTVIPPGTGPAWSSIVTGLDPSNHGVFDLIVRAEESYHLAFLNAGSLRAPTLWDLVGAFQGRVLVLNVPMTFPPRRVNGYMVTGLLTPPGSQHCTYPEDLIRTIRGIVPEYKIVPTQAYSPGRIGLFLDDVERVLESKIIVMRKLMEQSDWHFMMQVFNETDFIQHALWHVLDRDHPRHSRRDHRAYSDRILNFYRRLDTMIGSLVDSYGDQAAVIVLSDHGHGPLLEFVHANNLLLQQGVMKIRREVRPWIKYLLFKAGLTPLNVYKVGNRMGLGRLRMGLRWTSKGYGLLSRLFFSFSDIDWQRTSAYAISGGVFGGLFVNLKGREPAGAVSQDRYQETRDGLAGMLSGLRHPRDGAPLVAKILKREEIYSGRFTGEAPDLYFLPRDPTIGVFGDFEFSSNRILEPASEAISAQHRMEGVFMAQAPGLRRGFEAEGMRVTDIAPLVLYLMGLPIPQGLDGKLREDLFSDGILKTRPASYFKMEEVFQSRDKPRQSTEDESIKKRLKGLGYIS